MSLELGSIPAVTIAPDTIASPPTRASKAARAQPVAAIVRIGRSPTPFNQVMRQVEANTYRNGSGDQGASGTSDQHNDSERYRRPSLRQSSATALQQRQTPPLSELMTRPQANTVTASRATTAACRACYFHNAVDRCDRRPSCSSCSMFGMECKYHLCVDDLKCHRELCNRLHSHQWDALKEGNTRRTLWPNRKQHAGPLVEFSKGRSRTT